MQETITKIDWNILNNYIENNYISANKHPEYDLWVLNYSPKVQSGRCWDLFSLSCRGMVIDANGKILARCMRKFFNYGESDPYDIDLNQEYEIFNKVDGSMITIFWYDIVNQWIVASRGSFISDQAIDAKKILDSKPNIYNILNKNYTYVCEYLAPTNRIVVDYGDIRDLILLTKIENKTGKETSYNELINLYSKHFTIVEKFNIIVNNLIDLKKLEEENKEGFVIKFKDENKLKIKFDSYIHLHGILTNVSNIIIWEHLMNNYDFDELLERVPDEFYRWLNRIVNELRCDFNNIERLALKEFFRIYFVNEITDRKAFANEALKTNYHSILFKLYDKRPYDDIIWKMIKPTFSKPFSDGYGEEK